MSNVAWLASVPKATSVPKAKRKRTKREGAWMGLAFAAPALILFLVFRVLASGAGLSLSFFSVGIDGSAIWVGADNFLRLFADPVFWGSLGVTLLYTVIAVPASILVSLSLALLVRGRFRGVGFFRSAFFLPTVTSLVVAATIFIWIFSVDGPINQVAGTGSWLSSPQLVIPALVCVSVWVRFGYGMLILLSSLNEIPEEIEEAARLDGARVWHQIRWIILPHIRPAVFFLAITETAVSFQVFDLINVMTGGGPGRSSYALVMFLYDQGFRYFDFGYASAIGAVLFVLALTTALLQHLFIGREKK
jgi:multiple sugar transport system permease protein